MWWVSHLLRFSCGNCRCRRIPILSNSEWRQFDVDQTHHHGSRLLRNLSRSSARVFALTFFRGIKL